ncbi:hypothetical protein BJI47_00755 [Rhodococcus sp. 1168]|nr:hypothetical protein BJI47_00755 [Rhodococcus sp. 1168]
MTGVAERHPRKALQPDADDCVSDQRRVFAAVHLDGVEAGVAGLPGDGGSDGTVAGALRNGG